jgi:hypothetical protein
MKKGHLKNRQPARPGRFPVPSSEAAAKTRSASNSSVGIEAPIGCAGPAIGLGASLPGAANRMDGRLDAFRLFLMGGVCLILDLAAGKNQG